MENTNINNNATLEELENLGREVGIVKNVTMPWNCKQIAKMWENGSFKMPNFQRRFVWSNDQQSALIDSILTGRIILPVCVEKKASEEKHGKSYFEYFISDGQQRMTTIRRYRNGEFAISGLDHPVYYTDDEGEVVIYDLNGKYYDDLPEELKDAFDSRTINVIIMEGLTANESRTIFKFLNGGKALTAKEKSLAGCENLDQIQQIADSSTLFEAMLSANQKASKLYVPMVIKFWLMLNEDVENVTFDGKAFNTIVEHTQISADEAAEITSVMNFAVQVHDELVNDGEKQIAKKVYTETHIVSLFPFFKRAMSAGITYDEVADWMKTFFSGEKYTSKSAVYNETCKGSSSKGTSIRRRNEELQKDFEERFAEALAEAQEEPEEVEPEEEQEMPEEIETEQEVIEESEQEESTSGSEPEESNEQETLEL